MVTGSTPSTKEVKYYGDEYLFISPGDLAEKYISTSEKKLSKLGFDQCRKVPKGAIMFTCIGATIGKIGIASKELATNQQINSVIGQEIDNEFLYYQLIFKSSEIKSMAVAQTIPIINKSSFKSVNIILPPLAEQQRIVKILETWDKAIKKLEQKIEVKKSIKKGLMQRLLTGCIRLPGFSEDWALVQAGKIFKDISDKNHPSESLLSATQEFGVVPRDTLEGRVTMPAGSKSTYKLVDEGDFVISLRSFQGGIEYSNHRGIVSPAYTVLKSIIMISNDFYRFYFKSPEFISRLDAAVFGIRDGKQISYDDFCNINIPNPAIDEQKEIAKVLVTCDQELSALRRKLLILTTQKAYLLNNLITGRIRTPENMSIS